MALEKTIQVIEIDGGGIYLLDEMSGKLNIAAQRGFNAEFVDKIDALQVGEGFSGQVALSGKPLVVKNIAKDFRLTRTAVAEAGIRSVAVVPLSSKGKVPGTLFVVRRGRRDFSKQDIELLTSIGRQIGMAVENARLYEETKKKTGATGGLAGDKPGGGQHPGAECIVELDHPTGHEFITRRRGILNLAHLRSRGR